MSNSPPYMQQLGRLLRDARGSSSRAAVARSTGLGAGHLQKIEDGRLQGLTLSTLAKLSEGYGISPLTLLAAALDMPSAHLDRWASERIRSPTSEPGIQVQQVIDQEPTPAPRPHTEPTTTDGDLSKELLQKRIADWLSVVQRDAGDISLRELARRANAPPTTIAAAASGKAGMSLHLVLFRIAEVWPAGDYEDATGYWFRGVTSKQTPHSRIRQASDQLHERLRVMEPLLRKIGESACLIDDAASMLEQLARLPDAAEAKKLEKLELENRILRSQAPLPSSSHDLSSDALQDRLNSLRSQRPKRDLESIPSSPKLAPTED